MDESIGILGYGVEGRSSLQFLKKQGYHNIYVLDKVEPLDLPADVHFVGDFKAGIPKNIKTLIRSAGIRWDHPELIAFEKKGGILTSQVELFFDLVPSKNTIGVTGTLGKGTCCTLLHQILKNAGRDVYLGGNIGIPALELLNSMTPYSLAVLELSSFQLSTLRRSPHIGIILKTTSEHLDWHLSQEEYVASKSHLVRYQKPIDWTIYYQDQPASVQIAQSSPGKKISVGTQGDLLISKNSWTLSGKTLWLKEHAFQAHFFLQNAAAAAAAAQTLKVDDSVIEETCQSFVGLEHRLEFCGQSSNHVFINDSYATRPDATIGALEALSQKPSHSVGLILGGSEKNADFTSLVEQISQQQSVHSVALIGHTAPRLQQMLAEHAQKQGEQPKNMSTLPSLEEALSFLLTHIPTGTILLSPACASFGLFKDYKHRGAVFKEWVKKHLG